MTMAPAPRVSSEIPTTTAPMLRVEGLTRRFGERCAVDGLSFEVRAGELFALLGPNGAGKTTTIKMICGLLHADAGQITLGVQALRAHDPEARALVGLCPQELVLWKELTCIEQLTHIGELYRLSSSHARRRGLELLTTLGLADRRDALAATLSGGMQRRLNLALALVHDPPLVVLDEPEAGLDPQSRVLVRAYIRALTDHATVMLTSHDMDEVDRLADRVAIIDAGHLLALDTPAALKRTYGSGDLLELTFAATPNLAARVDQALAAFALTHTWAAERLQIRTRDGLEVLPNVLAALRQDGVAPCDVQLRAGTLEDVFLSLTGRELRI